MSELTMVGILKNLAKQVKKDVQKIVHDHQRHGRDDELILELRKEDINVKGRSRSVYRLIVRDPKMKTPAMGWMLNECADNCLVCTEEFGLLKWIHHCRSCGNIVCNVCSSNYVMIVEMKGLGEVRVCSMCYWGQEEVHSSFVIEAERGEKDILIKLDDNIDVIIYDDETTTNTNTNNLIQENTDDVNTTSTTNATTTNNNNHGDDDDSSNNNNDNDSINTKKVMLTPTAFFAVRFVFKSPDTEDVVKIAFLNVCMHESMTTLPADDEYVICDEVFTADELQLNGKAEQAEQGSSFTIYHALVRPDLVGNQMDYDKEQFKQAAIIILHKIAQKYGLKITKKLSILDNQKYVGVGKDVREISLPDVSNAKAARRSTGSFYTSGDVWEYDDQDGVIGETDNQQAADNDTTDKPTTTSTAIRSSSVVLSSVEQPDSDDSDGAADEGSESTSQSTVMTTGAAGYHLAATVLATDSGGGRRSCLMLPRMSRVTEGPNEDEEEEESQAMEDIYPDDDEPDTPVATFVPSIASESQQTHTSNSTVASSTDHVRRSVSFQEPVLLHTETEIELEESQVEADTTTTAHDDIEPTSTATATASASVVATQQDNDQEEIVTQQEDIIAEQEEAIEITQETQETPIEEESVQEKSDETVTEDVADNISIPPEVIIAATILTESTTDVSSTKDNNIESTQDEVDVQEVVVAAAVKESVFKLDIEPVPWIVLKSRKSKEGSKVFVNLCYHADIPAVPSSSNNDSNSLWDKFVQERFTQFSLNQVRYLMFIGPARETADRDGGSSVVNDVVVPAEVFQACIENETLNHKLCVKVLKALSRNLNTTMDEEYKLPKIVRNYKGTEIERVQMEFNPETFTPSTAAIITSTVAAEKDNKAAADVTVKTAVIPTPDTVEATAESIVRRTNTANSIDSTARSSTIAGLAVNTAWTSQWRNVLPSGANVVYTSHIAKRNAIGVAVMRQLILTDVPSLFYVDVKSQTVKGEVEWEVSSPPKATVVNGHTFQVEVPGRVYKFEDQGKNAKQWVEKINEVVIACVGNRRESQVKLLQSQLNIVPDEDEEHIDSSTQEPTVIEEALQVHQPIHEVNKDVSTLELVANSVETTAATVSTTELAVANVKEDTTAAEQIISEPSQDKAEEPSPVSFKLDIRPVPWIVLKSRKSKEGSKVFVNLCYHADIPAVPSSSNNDSNSSWDKFVQEQFTQFSLNQVRYLMFIGPARETADRDGGSSVVNDVVVPAEVFQACIENETLNHKICVKVLKALSRSLNTTLDEEYKLPKIVRNYKGTEIERVQMEFNTASNSEREKFASQNNNISTDLSANARNSSTEVTSNSPVTKPIVSSSTANKQVTAETVNKAVIATNSMWTSQWRNVLPSGANVVYTSHIAKRNAIGVAVMRQLILTDVPSLFYVDVKSQTVKGEVEWEVSSPPKATVVNGHTFQVEVPGRVYKFEDQGKNAKQWVEKINEVVSVIESNKK